MEEAKSKPRTNLLTSLFDVFIMRGFPGCFGVGRSGGANWQEAGLNGKKEFGGLTVMEIAVEFPLLTTPHCGSARIDL